MPDLFHVHQFFPDGTNECLTPQPLTAGAAVLRAKVATESVAARTGLVVRVIITDSGDYAVFDWEYGKGVVFPPPPEGAQSNGSQ